MNQYQTTMYNDLMSLCDNSEAFYFRDNTLDGSTYRVFTYRLASYSEFLAPNALECRGHLFEINPDGTPIRLASLPLPKFFNYRENPFTMDLDFDNPKQVMLKMDGSLISTYLHGMRHGELSTGELRLKSKTALASDQAVAAMSWLALPENIAFKSALETMARWNLTVILEWVSPDNRIVIGYEKPALVVLAVRDNLNGGYEFPGTLIGELPILRNHWVETYNHVTNMSEFIENAPGLQGIEGFVIQLASGQYVKIKTTAYLALHHTKDSINSPRRLFACVLEEASDDLRSLFADDPLAIATIQAMEDQVEKWHNHLATTVEGYYNANKHLDRKEYAIKGQQELDGKGFGLAMMKYLGKEVSYKEFMLKNYKLYGIKDDEPTVTTTEEE